LRYTKDEKKQKPYPIQFLAPGSGFPDVPWQDATFEEITGRFTLDWQVGEDTLVYGSIARGYKGGGFNPPAPAGAPTGLIQPTFDPEYVDSLEFGSKSTLMDGRVSLNTAAFYYDYQNYQVSRTINQTVATENLDAEITGLEFEAVFQATRDLQLNATLGLLKSKIKNGRSIDTLNRLQDSSDYTVVRSSSPAGFATSCLVPNAEVAGLLGAINGGFIPPASAGGPPTPEFALTTLCNGPMASPNAIEGIEADLSGNELPYAPGWTFGLGGQYDMQINDDLSGTLRVDYYVQDDSYSRVYNDNRDKLESYDNLNISYRLDSASTGLEVLFYARNLLSEDTIISSYPTGDESGGHLLASGKERPMYGVSLTKYWD
jgi:outer membrane receptor protein involved in Fe transport